jgi:hypothetical protein
MYFNFKDLITAQNCNENAAECVTYITQYATMSSFMKEDDVGHKHS